MRRLFRFVVPMLVVLAALAAVGVWWVNHPFALKSDVVEVHVAPRTPVDGIVQAVVDGGVDTSPTLLSLWFRLSGKTRQIKAGHYEFERGLTPRNLLSYLTRGDGRMDALTLIDGWTWRQVKQALAKQSALNPDSQALSDAELMAKLGKPGVSPEGRFMPDTYNFGKGTSDLVILRQAMQAMDRNLAAAWALRTDDSPLKTPDDLLKLASIVEKETGRASDRNMVGAVFNNRLKIGMRLQTDPTVIYGLGESFDGNLTRKHLQTDTPYNSYTRAGLPPTPIALPGKASLLAAVQPADSKALYFVARGDGSSEFSNNLDAHNRAVNRYQRGQ